MTAADSGSDTDLDGPALRSYLAAELDTGVENVHLLSDGLNLVAAVSTSDGRSYVLRRPTAVRESSLFVGLRSEYGLLERLQDTPVPAPEPVLFCDDGSVLGDRFFLTTHLDGEPLPRGADLPERFRDAESRRRVGESSVGTLAGIHSLAVDRFEAVLEHQTPLEQVDRATDRLDAATGATDLDVPTLYAVGDWLREHAPPATDRRTALVHGDYRPGNLLFAGESRPELTGVLDWETAMLGDPSTELGYFLIDWRGADDPLPPLDPIEAKYAEGDGLAGVRRIRERGLSPFTGKPGSPTRRELVARYEAETGEEFEHGRFYRAHAAFMLASVWADLHRHRVASGADPDMGPIVDYMALIARRIADGEFPL